MSSKSRKSKSTEKNEKVRLDEARKMNNRDIKSIASAKSFNRYLLPILVWIGIGIHFIFASWWVLNGEMLFTSTIARDFFLLQELDQKKIVLIGPSSSTGLFHGPLWTYINYPAYLLGGGNPVVVGWFWMLLSIVSVVAYYFIAKDLFGKKSGYLFAVMMSLYLGFHAHEFYNPHGAMLLIPVFFYTFIKYIRNHRVVFLTSHLLIGSMMVQFQLAVGIPLVILSSVFLLIAILKSRHKMHIFSFALFPLGIINFIAFDFRHDFLLTNIVKRYLISPAVDKPDYMIFVQERIRLLFSSPEIIRADPGYYNLVLFFILLGMIALQLWDKKQRDVYFSFLYFYVGFFVLSLINSGPLLYFYLFPIFPLVFLIFSSFTDIRKTKVYIALFIIVYLYNFNTILKDIRVSQSLIGKDIYSWKFLSGVASDIFENERNNFGYFVYSPNVVAFEGKYAMQYAGKNFSNSKYFSKDKVTYLIIAPPPPDNQHMTHQWWVENMIHITSAPVQVVKYSNGYVVQKHLLSVEELLRDAEAGADPGLHFR